MKVSNWGEGGEVDARRGLFFSPGMGPRGCVQQAPGRCRSTSVQEVKKSN